ncbi:alpha-2-macroglobulin family protein [Desulfolutivibrio sulfoxidireducens]|uniref:alpha-2-macroglobulin family protein n=1 Tax=Desulfolutivibrio sulfoxidireducens TaxID=2773299 RepID=UPI00159DD470|nr:alpha-2-macroglobulin [Desulfolutivibrio sulfoxidireducens]QLA20145.1 alpha-2-macroglobulin family protein [Desulfolutivibrio sulfoxidireducens]
MPAPERAPWFKNWKNQLILILLVIVVAQFAALTGMRLSRTPDAPPPSPVAATPNDVAVAGVSMEAEQGRALLVAFDHPVAGVTPGSRPTKDPAVISPSVAGTWTWINPFMLRFEPAEPFAPAKSHAITLTPDNIVSAPQRLTGETKFAAAHGVFEVSRLSAHLESAADEAPGMVRIEGEVVFNRNADPKALLEHLKILDPLRGDGDPVPFYIPDSSPGRKLAFVSDPIPQKVQARDVALVLSPGMIPEKGGVPLGAQVTTTVPVVLDPVLRVDGVTAQSQGESSVLRIAFSTPVAAEALDAHLAIAPEVARRVHSEEGQLVVTGGFTPGREYRVTLTKGLTAADGAILEKDASETVFVPDLDPMVVFQDQGMFLSRTGYKNLAIKSVNTESAQLIVDRVYLNNLFAFLNFDYSAMDEAFTGQYLSHSLGDRLVKTRLPLSAPQNTAVTTPVNLEKYISEHTPGLYRVALSLPDQYEGGQRLVLITDLGVVAKRGNTDILVFVASFSNLASVSGATVRILSDQNQEIARGTTDASGLFRAKLTPEFAEKNRPSLITVEKGNDFSFLLFDSFRTDTTGMDVDGRVLSTTGYTAFLYGERDIYRPGETVRGMAMVRDTALGTPGPMPLTLRQLDPQGRKIGDTVVRTDEAGMAPFTLPLPSYLVTGPYVLELLAGERQIGEYRFQVEDFVPDRINVAVTPGQPQALPGQKLGYTVTSRYLFGAPASDLPVETRIRLTKAAFAPKGFENYTFGDPERSFEDTEFFQAEENLDADGARTFEAALPENVRPPAALEAVITARVREGGGRGVTSLARVPVHAYPSYPGLKRLDREGREPGRPLTLEYVNVAASGTEAKAGELKARFHKDDWQTVLRREPDGSYKYDSVRDSKLLDVKTIAAGTSRGGLTFTPPTVGSYRVTLTDSLTGAASQVEFFCGGFGYSPWALENPARIELVPDKKEYASGETATFQVRAPFAGRMLVTVENEEVREAFLMDLAGNTGQIAIPVRPEYMPNAYVTATVVRTAKDLQSGAAARAFGAAPLFTDRAEGRLEVLVDVPGEMRPGAPLAIDVTTRSGAVLTVAAVDEGILQLIAQKTPDPYGEFYAKRELAVSSYDTFCMLLPEVPPLHGKSLAGGGDSMEDLSKFLRSESPASKLVAFWSGLVTADGQGKARVSFDVPEFRGAVRIMVVAADGKRFGSAEASTRVKSPLSVSPSFPRFLSLEETVDIPVAVRNDTPRPGDFAVTLTVTGPATCAEPHTTVHLEPGQEKTLFFPVRTGSLEGIATLVSEAAGNGEKAASSQDLSCRSPLPAISDLQAGGVDTARTTLKDLAAGYVPGTVRRDIFVGRQPLLRFAPDLRRLLQYPHGCVEQTVSKAFPLLYFSDLAKVLAPDLLPGGQPAAMVQATVRRLAGMQLYQGGFSMWPGGQETVDWPSIYATHFLVEAKAAGYLVDEDSLKRALRFVAGLAKDASPSDADDDQGENSGPKVAAYALYVLARAGKADIGAMDYLRGAGGDLPADARGLLGAAYAAVGNAKAAGALLSGPPPSEKTARSSGGTFDSPLRDTALYLTALMDAAPKDPRLPKLAADTARLFAAVGHPSTQESAFAFLALGRYYARQAAKKPFTGKLYAGKTLLSDFDAGKPLLLRNIPDAGELRLEMDGGYEAGSAFFSVETRGVPVLANYKPVREGLEILREYLDRQGNPLSGDTVPQGTLLVLKTSVRSPSGTLKNVAIQNLLPTGIEVENPRLATTEKLPWMTADDLETDYVDYRGDRINVFADLPDEKWRTQYSLVRAVTPGTFTVPPPQAEAMYDPSIVATGLMGKITVSVAK